jgi:thiamine biosynthesis lipoprotein
MHAQWSALGTSVVLRVSERAALADARATVEADLAHVDRACSRFREDSDLSRVNARPGHSVRVGAVLVEALQVALRAARLTAGDVDPALGAALVLAGYDRDWALIERGERVRCDARRRTANVPRVQPRVRAHVRGGWRTIELDPELRTVRVPRGVQLDLGATAKAWAADRAARAVHEATGSGALVSLGGDIGTAGEAPPGGWLVHVTDDHRAGPTAPGHTITIRGGGLATSSVAVRRWMRAGTEMHHIIDPRTGAPARASFRTVSVAAGDCTDANIASTAALVRGEDAPAWLAELGLPARLVAADGRVQTFAGWPAEVPQSDAEPLAA